MLNIGQVLNGRYKVIALLGEGGMGAVYRASDRLFDRDVALKEFRLGDLPSETESFEKTDQTIVRNSQPVMLTREKAMEQFFAEAKLLAKLDHPNLPKVYDFFNQGFEGYLSMTLIEGSSLEKILADKGGPLDEETVQSWLMQIMNALGYCHLNDVIHRDLKPANLLLGPNGLVYLVDFGIAKLLVTGQKETSTGARAYSPGYAPPEQYSGRGGTNSASDIYSLGATAYALLTNTTPVEPNDQISGEVLAAPRAINPAISERMERFILACLQLKRSDRPQTIEQALDLLLGSQPMPVIPTRQTEQKPEEKVKEQTSPAAVPVDSKPLQNGTSNMPSAVASNSKPLFPASLQETVKEPGLAVKKKKFPVWLVILLLAGAALVVQFTYPGGWVALFSGSSSGALPTLAIGPSPFIPSNEIPPAGNTPEDVQSSPTIAGGSAPSMAACPDANPEVGRNSHSISKNAVRSFTYKVYFTNTNGWGDGKYSFELRPDAKTSSFFCGTGSGIRDCSVMATNTDLLYCWQDISFSLESANRGDTVYCDYDIFLYQDGCGDIYSYSYSYEFPVK